MATITEDYVSFETAKLLKEKGFDVNTINFWHIVPSETCDFNALEKIACGDVNELEYSENYYPMITLQMAMKWLREVHKILILVEYDYPVFSSDIYKMDEVDEYGSAKHMPPTFANCKYYEQACEAAIKYCLEHLI